MNLLILGRSEILYEAAVFLAKRHDICGIITAPGVKEYSKDEKDFSRLADEINCPYLCIKSLNRDAIRFIQAAKPDIGISVNWVSIIREEVTDLIPMGILNAHLGDLPRYRGNAVVNWAILRNEPSITFTVHFMEPGELDSGRILVQREFILTPRSTMKHVIDFAVAKAPKMFEEALYGLEWGTIQPRRQDAAKKSPFRCYPRIPSDSKIDWCKSAREIDALIRASSDPYSGAYSYLKTGEMIKKVYIWKSRIILEETEDIGTPGHIVKNEKETGESWVLTGKGILAICLVQYEGEDGRFGPGNVWRSIRMRFGVDIEDEILRLHLALSRLKPGLSDMAGPTGKE